MRSALARWKLSIMINSSINVLVHRRASRLDDEHVAAANVFIDFAGNFAVGKIADRNLAQRQAEIFANPPREIGIRPAAEDFEVVHGVE